jgi:hypothetical protein
MKRLLLIAAALLAATAAGAEDIPMPRERPIGGVTQLFDTNGKRVGMAVQIDDNTTIFYDVDGRKVQEERCWSKGKCKMIKYRRWRGFE